MSTQNEININFNTQSPDEINAHLLACIFAIKDMLVALASEQLKIPIEEVNQKVYDEYERHLTKLLENIKKYE